MSEPFSRKVFTHLQERYRPGDRFTSRDVAAHFGYGTAIAAVTAALFWAKQRGAVVVDDIKIISPGVRQFQYRMVDPSKLFTPYVRAKTPSVRLKPGQPEEPVGKPLPTSLRNVRGYLSTAIKEIDTLMASERPKPSGPDVPSMSTAVLVDLAEQIVRELRRRKDG